MARPNPHWFIPVLLLLIAFVAAVMIWLEPYIASAAGTQKARVLENLTRGGLLDYVASALHLGAWIGIVIIFRPAVLICVVLLLEKIFSRNGNESKNFALAWSARASFLLAAYCFGLLLNYIHPPLPGPLLDFADADSPVWLEAVQMAFLLLLTVLATDLFQYWAHRSFHRFACLWKFHAVHHSPRDLDVLHSFQHPVEGAATWFLVALPLSLMIGGYDVGQLSLLAAFVLVQTDLAHTKAPIHLGPLGVLLVDNRYHFVHHSRDPRHLDKNFAAYFPIFDVIFGTYSKPERGPLPPTGLPHHLPPQRLSHFFLAHLPEDRDAGR